MEFLENAAIANTLALPCRARWLVEANTREEVHEAMAWAQEQGVRVLPLGSGSNVVLPEKIDALVLKLCNRGISVADDQVKAEAGENWHGFVEASMKLSRYGLENLALIPGQVGAAPIQNIGAYGVELENCLHSVDVLNKNSLEFVTLSHSDCSFSYRSSRFKSEPEWIVVGVTLTLSVEPRPVLDYPGILQYLETHGLSQTPENVFQAVVAIRRAKLPDPGLEPNAGSFFKNPIVNAAKAEAIATEYPSMPQYAAESEGGRKLSAAWLIEQAGLKGFVVGGFGVSEKHALVITNQNDGRRIDLETLSSHIQAKVTAQFGVDLDPEPGMVSRDGQVKL